jgi:membrane-bound metal-dependent hydrolase YbcI (DUF457 family)
MIAGHYSAALAAKRVAPTVALWHLFVAVQLIDILFSVFVLLGVEKLRIVPGITRSNALDLYYMPYTHSLVGAIAWSLATGVAYAAWKTGRPPRAALVLGLAVFSHWLLDLPVHRPDLPLYDNAYKVGLGLWNVPVAAFLLEAVLVVGALAAYGAGGPSARRPRRGALLILGAVLLALTVWSYVGPPAPSATVAVASGLVLYVVLAVAAAWVERSARAHEPSVNG